jgi:hypothetical protein
MTISSIPYFGFQTQAALFCLCVRYEKFQIELLIAFLNNEINEHEDIEEP